MNSSDRRAGFEAAGRRSSTGVIFALVVVPMLLVSSSAGASPWTLPSDELTLTMDQQFEQARYEYLPDGTYQQFPLEGRYRAQKMMLGARYGFTDRFEGAMNVEIANVGYRADSVIVEDFEEPPSSGEATSRILDFNTSRFGAADVRLSGRYNLHRGKLMVTTGTTAKLPTGYEPPAGTFVTDEEGTRRVRGQATLGDGQTDLTQSLLVGTWFAETRTFFRASLGARYRFGAPGHQVVGDAKIGQDLGDSLVLVAGVDGVRTVTEGEVVGQTAIAEDPSVPTREFTADNIRNEDLRLDRNALNLTGGLIADFGDVEVTGEYRHTLTGRNTAAIHAVSIGTIVTLPEVTGR